MLRAARLGLLPHEIEDLAPYELGLVLEGRQQRDRDVARLVAWNISWMATLHLGTEVSIATVMHESESLGGGNDFEALEAAEEEAARRREAAEAAASEGWFEEERVHLDTDDGPLVGLEDGD